MSFFKCNSNGCISENKILFPNFTKAKKFLCLVDLPEYFFATTLFIIISEQWQGIFCGDQNVHNAKSVMKIYSYSSLIKILFSITEVIDSFP